MTEHTKGPWRTKIDGNPDDEDYSGEGIFIQVQNKDDTWAGIALVTFYGNDDCNAEIDLANARLIAVAPNLLEACKQAWEDTQGSSPSSYLRATTICMLKAAIAKANSELAK